MSSEKRSVKRVIVPSPVPELPGVASVTCGTVSAAVLKDALEWARPNQALLMQTWQELNG